VKRVIYGCSITLAAMLLASTTLVSPDNKRVVVPNNSIWGNVITNVTGNSTRRIDLVFGIGYGDDIAKAHATIEELVKAHPMVLAAPQPVIKVHELADSSVNFVCRPWAKTSDYWDVYWDLTRSVKETFDDRGISIPFPQHDVHVHQEAS
jgi:small conductance mechanosensitive channel